MGEKGVSDYQVIGTRRFHELQPGDKFLARIHDIRPGEVTIKFKDGSHYTARSKVLPEARIGEESLFSVKANDFEGRIVLEMVKLDADIKKDKMLTAALLNAGLAPTEEMLELARMILEGGLPVDAPTLQKGAELVQDIPLEEVIIRLQASQPPGFTPAPPPQRYTFDMRV